jgi:hypothetical protein
MEAERVVYEQVFMVFAAGWTRAVQQSVLVRSVRFMESWPEHVSIVDGTARVPCCNPETLAKMYMAGESFGANGHWKVRLVLKEMADGCRVHQ